MKHTWVTFPCGGILLEGVWDSPQTSEPAPAVIICHPHPLYGGDMDNNVVLAIYQALSQQSIAVLRFNFRGVGNSHGTFGNGIAEQKDVAAALAFVSSSPDVDPERIGLAGYSFGAGVVAPVAAQDSRAKLIALVSPALSDSAWQQLKNCPKPKLLISGEYDFVVPRPQFQRCITEVTEPKQCEVIPGADHFWQGYEEAVATKVARFFVTSFHNLRTSSVH